MQLGEEDAAIEEYKKYIIGCPLFPSTSVLKKKSLSEIYLILNVIKILQSNG